MENLKQNPIVKKLGLNRILLVCVLILMFLVFKVVLGNKFPAVDSIKSTLNYVYFLGFLSLGVTFVIATGGIDFSIGQTTVELCSTEAQAILSQENCIAVFGSNQVSAEGVLAANANLNVLGSDPANGDVVGVGFDAGSIIKAAVKDGTFIGAVTQSPLMMGYYAIYALTAAANGQELQDVPTDGYWYDATNMEDEDIAPNLYD